MIIRRVKRYLRWGPGVVGAAAAYAIVMALRVDECRVGCVTDQVAHDTRLIGFVIGGVLVGSFLLALIARLTGSEKAGLARASMILAAIGLIAFVAWAIWDSYVELALNSET